MGEKGGGKGDDAEKKKAAEGGGAEKKDEGRDKKSKDDGSITVELKVDMHCEGCARKLRHSVKGFEGVEKVSTDCPSGKLMVVGKVDPWTLRDRVESKTHKNVVLVSPTNLPKKDDKKARGADDKKADQKPEQMGEKGGGKGDDAKKKAASKHDVLKVDMNCKDRVEKRCRSIKPFEGVEKVCSDLPNDKLMVVGKVDPGKLRPQVEKVTGRKVTLSSTNLPKKDDKTKPNDRKPKEVPVKHTCARWTTLELVKARELEIERLKNENELLRKKIEDIASLLPDKVPVKHTCECCTILELLKAHELQIERLKNENELLKKKIEDIASLVPEKSSFAAVNVYISFHGCKIYK